MPNTPPRHWPPNARYLNSYQYHSSVPDGIRRYITGAHHRSTEISKDQLSQPLVTIRAISSPSHPAFGQYGLFAAKKIPPRTRILDYIGEVHCDDRNSDYDLSLYRSQDGVNVGVDASKCGNEARYINDFRGIRNKPNALFADGRTTSGELRMNVWSGSEAIKKGEEILVSYGKSWWRARNHDCEETLT
jgi:hypothetical protein